MLKRLLIAVAIALALIGAGMGAVANLDLASSNGPVSQAIACHTGGTSGGGC